MIEVNATILITFVPSAIPFFGATFFAASIISPSRQLSAFHLLIHVTAATFNAGLLIAWWTLASVTLALANMRTTWLSAG